MANQDFVVRSGIQINTNLVVGSYWLANAAPVNGAIISGNVGIGTATPAKELTVQNDTGATTYYADLGIPNINPSISMIFTNRSSTLDSRISFTRASNATITTSTGNIAIISNNVPAFDYDPATLQPLGLRIESSRTNLARYNISITGTGWGAANSTVYTSNVYSPDGTINASNLVVTGTGGGDTGYAQVSYSIVVGGTTFYTNSVFAKKGNADVIDLYTFYTGGASARASYLRYTFSTDTLVASTAEGPGVFPITYGRTIYPNGWIRFYWSTYDNLGTSTTNLIRLYAGTRTSVTTGTYTYYWGVQGESGIYPTSLIYNNGPGSATRSADVASISPISSWFNPTQGTLRVTAQVQYLIDSQYQTAAEICNSSNGNSQLIVARYNTGGSPQVRAIVTDGNGYTISNQITNTWSNAAVSTTTLSYNTLTGVYASAFNAAPVGSTVNTVPIWNTVSPTQLNLGNRASGLYFLDGYIRNLSYYPASQSNAVVQSFSLP
jgi:hypothetical protein